MRVVKSNTLFDNFKQPQAKLSASKPYMSPERFLASEVGIAVVFALMLSFQSATLGVVATSSDEPQIQGPPFLLFGNVTLGTTFLTQPRVVHLRVDIEGQRWSWSMEMNKTSSYAFKYGGSQSPSKRGTLTVRIPHGGQSTHVIRHAFQVTGVQRLDIDERDIDPEEERSLSTNSLPGTTELVLLFDGPAPLPTCAGEDLTESYWPMSTVHGAQCSVQSIVSSLKLIDDLTCEWREEKSPCTMQFGSWPRMGNRCCPRMAGCTCKVIGS
ncbi:unnamed protein product [Closterium sp. Yama58-4]|nr:unnamed protein product [Closterium sp. Yama58-4]